MTVRHPDGSLACICHEHRPVCNCVPLTDTQLRFVRLHQRHFVTEWRSVFNGAMMRAKTDRGVTATITTDEMHDLCERGLMMTRYGYGLALTDTGKKIA